MVVSLSVGDSHELTLPQLAYRIRTAAPMLRVERGLFRYDVFAARLCIRQRITSTAVTARLNRAANSASGAVPATTCSGTMANSSGLKDCPSRTSFRGVTSLYQGSVGLHLNCSKLSPQFFEKMF